MAFRHIKEHREQSRWRQTNNALARLFSGELDDREVKKIRRWQRGDPQARQDFLDALHILDDVQALGECPKYQAEYQEIAVAPVDSARVRRWPTLATAAGILLMALVAASLFVDHSRDADIGMDIKRYATRVGEQKTIVLSDGSELTLNTTSEALVDITDTYRRVSLERGEAFFKVARDATRPFAVKVDARSVTVLGTSFNILKTPEQFTLAVLEGRVAVHKTEEQVIAAPPRLFPESDVSEKQRVIIDSPGQRLVSAGTVVKYLSWKDRAVASHSGQIQRITSWRKGLLRYDGQPLSSVVQELNRYSAKKILIEDASVMDINIYATLRINRINVALSDLEKILPIKVVQYFDRIVISKKPENGE